MATATKATPKKGSKTRRAWKAKFLKALGEAPNVSAAAMVAGVSRQHAYKERARDEKFADSWDEIEEAGVDKLVAESFRRATEGTEKPVYWQGTECGTVQQYSDTLAIFLLKCHRPDVYRETVRKELSGVDGGPIEVSTIEDELLEAKIYNIASNLKSAPKPGKAKPAAKKGKGKKKAKSKAKKKSRPKPRPMG